MVGFVFGNCYIMVRMEERLFPRIREMKLFPALFWSLMIHALLLGVSKNPSAGYSGQGVRGAVDARLVANLADTSVLLQKKGGQRVSERREDVAANPKSRTDGVFQVPEDFPEPSMADNEVLHGSQETEDLYFTTDYLTRRPEALSEIELAEMPFEPLERGGVVLALRISPAGEVVSASIVRSSISADAALHFRSAFEKLKFRPGEIHGKAVGVLMWVEAGYADAAENDEPS